ncbi:MAG: COQ9 family protein, partial [Pseudomonadota bacterium]
MTTSYETNRDSLLAAALPHVPFEGWTEITWRRAVTDTGIDATVARAICPRGALDLVVAFHARGDAEMTAWLRTADLSDTRLRGRIAAAVRKRLELVEADKEAVRRGTTLLVLPQNADTGVRMLWDTADSIWSALGDASDDINWYTKRLTLSGVYASTMLFWLGDDSAKHRATWEFLDRRIEDVMRFEKAKSHVNDNKALRWLLTGPLWALGK